MRTLKSTMCLIALSIAASLPARAAVVYVKYGAPGPAHDGASWATAFTTIQPALDAAHAGDEVWVAGGYAENVTLRTPNVAVYGGFYGSETSKDQRPPKSITKLTPDTTDPLFTITAEASGALLDNFEITRAPVVDPPGIVCRATGVTISRCLIHDCGAIGSDMGGVFCGPGSSVTIRDCSIYRNAARDGGGILAQDAALTLVDSDVDYNDALVAVNGVTIFTDVTRGGGIAILGGTATLDGNNIDNNSAAWGGGLWAENATLTITRNFVQDNTAYRESPATVGILF